MELSCLSIEAIPSVMPKARVINLDGFYHHFQGCKCSGDLTLVRDPVTGRGQCRKGKGPKVSLGLALPVAICGALVLALLLLLAWTWFSLNKERLYKAYGPPGKRLRCLGCTSLLRQAQAAGCMRAAEAHLHWGCLQCAATRIPSMLGLLHATRTPPVSCLLQARISVS